MSERVSVEPVAKIRVVHGGHVVAETASGFVIHEQGLPDRYYVPPGDVHAQLSPGTGQGTCPWKGEWRHLDVTVEGERIANGAWTYFDTKRLTRDTQDFVAFYETKFDIVAA
ncbi:MAG TPA: DUF427 domain-containing protein [Kofleriaceae bacterium]|jgi:uncharacterized protein (DUF427 family)